jgi:hypothetical protein
MIEGVGFVHGLSTRYVRDGLLRAANPDISVDDGYGRLDELAAQCPPGSPVSSLNPCGSPHRCWGSP